MRVFVTGASGFVGSAVVQELLANGHSVVGLARSDASAAAVEKAGATVLRGTLEDRDSLRRGAAEAEGVVHTAFNHDFSKFAENGEVEKQAIAALGEALAGTNRPLIVTSGTAFLSPGKVGTEDMAAVDSRAPRNPEGAAFAFLPQGVRASVVRLSPSVHGRGDHGFVPVLIGIAREKGFSAYIGEGANHWPAVHRLDAARVFRLALERGTPGARYHAAAEQGIAFRDIATAIAEGLKLPAKSIAQEELAAHFGWFARFAGIDNQVSSALTRSQLGWAPSEPGLLDDLAAGHYFGQSA
ncbi:MAG TPA: SDR family oxidoreductase [Devosia sp.]|nr:SDR family oxidoreductase [Devosia sp.]